jgi:hypothetical protein
MKLSSRLYLAGITLLFVVLIMVQHYTPKPISWTITCNIHSKSPYGCYVLNDMFKTLFPGQQVTENNNSLFVSLDTLTEESQNLIVITPGFDPDEYDLKALLSFVSKGNRVFISSTNMGQLLLDTLHLSLASPVIDTSALMPGKEVLFLNNQQFKCDSGYHYDRKMPLVSFSTYDSLTTRILGTDRRGAINFIGIDYGLGKLYLHTQPLVFTNYHLLYGNVEYASNVLSYLPVQPTSWDNYYKPDYFRNDSPVRYILSQPPLRAAYYVLLFSLLLYMVVESKRKQRIIPVITPPENRSLEYVKTIGGLYFKQHNNLDLIRKRVIYFKEFLREHYHIGQFSDTKEYAELVSAKTGVSVEQVSQLLGMIHYFDKVSMVSDISLLEFNNKMELFYEQCL